MKMALIRDVLDIVVPKDITTYRGAFTLGPCEPSGGFSVLYDEALEKSAVATVPSRLARSIGPAR